MAPRSHRWSAPNAQKAVLVSGASTGIGCKIAKRRAKEGYFVYDGARKEQDLKELNAIPNVHSLRLDVTSLDDIGEAVNTVTHAAVFMHSSTMRALVSAARSLKRRKKTSIS